MIDPSYYCPGCNRLHCACPSAWEDDALAEAAYDAGYEAGQADGPEERPTAAEVRRRYADGPAGQHPERYLEGYDDGAEGRPHDVLGGPVQERPQEPSAGQSGS